MVVKLSQGYMAETMLAFRGVWTGVAGALIEARQPVQLAVEMATKIALEIEKDPNETMGIVIPEVSINDNEKTVEIYYTSRSGTEYKWTFVPDWYECTFEFPESSNLYEKFLNIKVKSDLYNEEQGKKRQIRNRNRI